MGKGKRDGGDDDVIRDLKALAGMANRPRREDHPQRGALDRAELDGGLSPDDARLAPVGTWTGKHGDVLDKFRKEVLNVYKRYNNEYEVGYLELLGVLNSIILECNLSAFGVLDAVRVLRRREAEERGDDAGGA